MVICVFAPEAIRTVNSGLKSSNSSIEEVEIGRYYGNKLDRTLRVVHNEMVLHPFQPYITEATANQIEYFERVFGIDSGLSIQDQVWYWKELLGLIFIMILISNTVIYIPL